MLEMLLAKLNQAIVDHNKEVDECVSIGQLTEAEAKGLRWLTPVTRQTVHDCDVWNGWPKALLNIVGEIVHAEHAKTIIQLAKSVKNPTSITTDLLKGSANSKGATIKDYSEPVGVTLIQMAHLVARADASEAANV